MGRWASSSLQTFHGPALECPLRRNLFSCLTLQSTACLPCRCLDRQRRRALPYFRGYSASRLLEPQMCATLACSSIRSYRSRVSKALIRHIILAKKCNIVGVTSWLDHKCALDQYNIPTEWLSLLCPRKKKEREKRGLSGMKPCMSDSEDLTGSRLSAV